MEHTIGLQMYTLREQIAAATDPLDVYKKVRAAGYTSVQAKLSHDMTPVQLKAVLDEAGLTPLSFNGNNFGHLLGILRDPKVAIEGAHALGVTTLDIGTVFIENRDTEYGYQLFADLINKAGRIVAKEGLKLSYHNHALEFHRFESGRSGMDVLVEDSDPAVLNFCLDCHWMQAGGVSQVQWLRRLAGRMTMVHFKDYGIDLGTTVVEVSPRLFKAVGEGNIHWQPIVEVCKEIGIRDYVVEQDRCDRDPYDCIASSYRYIKNNLGL